MDHKQKYDQMMAQIRANKRKGKTFCVWCEVTPSNPHAYDPERLGLCYTCGKVYKQIASRNLNRVSVSFPLILRKEADQALRRAMEHFDLAYQITRQSHSRGGKQHQYELHIG